jgi:hypothetical protein
MPHNNPTENTPPVIAKNVVVDTTGASSTGTTTSLLVPFAGSAMVHTPINSLAILKWVFIERQDPTTSTAQRRRRRRLRQEQSRQVTSDK